MSLNRIACERIIRIVRDLRNFARLDEAEFKMANLNEDIETTLNLVRHELKDRIQVVKEFSDLPLVPCYPNRMNQVFMNLLINAYQSIQGKGQIRISTALIDHEVKISISDSGTGIKKEHLARIFDPGFTTKGVGVGTGLGLSISARIIQDHKGTISVQSEAGKGSTFTISLPINHTTGPITPPTSGSPAPKGE
jgi:two-component system NtrC family sensor kinase